MEGDVRQSLDAFLASRGPELVALRRDLHAHPEPSFAEHRTTRVVAERLTAAGLHPVVLPRGTGLLVDIAAADNHYPERTVVALRADLDALPMDDEKDVPYRSTIPGACHACGHDVHTTMLVGAGLFLAEQASAGLLPGPVRLIFQPAEEEDDGAPSVIAAGGLESVGRIFALHCDPRLDVGKLGIRSGPITAACDHIRVTVSGPGGHTARPHLTADVVYALAKIVTELPAALSRRVDPRAGLSLVWGRMSAGSALNAIANKGTAEGTVRCLDEEAWAAAPALIDELVRSVAGAYHATVELDYQQNIPPTVNEAASAAMFATAAESVLGPDGVTYTQQSLGAEDFAWYLRRVPGALARLGTRTPGGPDRDLHQPSFDVDERAIGVGVSVMVATALTALWHSASAPEPPEPPGPPGSATPEPLSGAAEGER